MANKKQKASYEARLRAKWYFLVEKAGKTVDEVCELYLISRKTYYKWRKKDLGSRIHVPKKEHPETKIKGEIKIFISEQKLRLNYGPKKMSLLVKRRFDVSISTTSTFGKVQRINGRALPRKSEEWVAEILARFAGASENARVGSGCRNEIENGLFFNNLKTKND